LVLNNMIFPASAFPIEEMVDPTGAGDSFAGAFMGYLSYKKDLTIERLKEAMIYGSVLGAYAIEDFGVNKLLEITKVDIDYRYEMFRRITQF
jgi:sugar/nucleoside kinase (ribokinase family)